MKDCIHSAGDVRLSESEGQKDNLFVQVRVKAEAMEESGHMPCPLWMMYVYVWQQGVLDKRQSSAALRLTQ